VATPSSTNAQPVDAAEAARLKREARKAKILGRGTDRLARITNTGRGAQGSAWLDTSVTLPSVSAPAPPISTSPNPASSQTDKGSASAQLPGEDADPLEVDISSLPKTSVARQAGDQQQPGFQQMPQNPMEALMTLMGGAGAGAGQGGSGGFGGGGPEGDMAGLQAQIAAMMQGMGGGQTGDPNQPGGGPFGQQMTPAPIKVKSLYERAFDLLQAGLVAGLAIWAAYSSMMVFNSRPISDALNGEKPFGFADVTINSFSSSDSPLLRWARLAYQSPSQVEWERVQQASSLSSPSSFFSFFNSLPLFWVFITLEIVLQSARIVLFESRAPPPPSFVQMIASQLPIRNLALYIRTGSKYLSLASALVNDVALMVFCIGMTILYCDYRVGGAEAL
ncbi:hypothetical protein IE53DRAFT_293431, partial [Violaceomyces palustris]